jgi:chromosome segregation ATPase
MQLQTAVEAAHDEVTELRGQLRSAQENFERAARMLSDSEEELARTSEQLKRLTDEVSTIRGTLGWRAMNAARRALPARSRRGALARRAIRALRTRSR